MITTLHIKNIGIIEDLNLDLNNGLNVLTGETGAGKTLIIDSLNIISGGRFSKEMIRKGETNSFVELCIYDPNLKEAIEGNVIISREICSNGRNMCKINGRMVTVNELREFMKNVIEIHGQNENQNLIDVRTHIKYLDDFIGEEINNLKQTYQRLYYEYISKNKELKENFGDEKERQRKIDLLQYQISEIEEANLKTEEEEILEEKRKKMLNSEKIIQNLQEADICIGEKGIDVINSAIRALEKIENIDSNYSNMVASLKNIYYDMQEIARDIKNDKEGIDFEEEEREQTEQRLDYIHSLKRKYGNTIQEILEYKQEIEKEMDKLKNSEENNKKLEKEIQNLEEEMSSICELMNKIRKEKAIILGNSINKELQELEMKNAKIHVKVEKSQEFNSFGKNNVEIFIATNVGEEEKPLAKIASGGEMSRIMLAIKKVLAQTDKISVLVFDEIDTGISGKAANSVAEKLNEISKNHQVLCISHLPKIAAVADYNYFISKKINNERTCTNVKLLKGKEILHEIARISTGEVSDESLKYAMSLINKKRINVKKIA